MDHEDEELGLGTDPRHFSPATLRMARAALRITADEVATKIGIPRPALSNYEVGKHLATENMVARIATAIASYGVTWTTSVLGDPIVRVPLEPVLDAEGPENVKRKKHLMKQRES